MDTRLKNALLDFNRLSEDIQTMTAVPRREPERERNARIKRLRSDYAAFVDYYFPHYTTDRATGRRTPCAPFHIAAARGIKADPNIRAAFVWHRGAAKSTHMDIFVPLWLKCQEPRQLNVMVLVGKSEDNARTLLADIQAELQFNQRYTADFGAQYKEGSWEDGQFVTADGTAFFARGRGQSPRGLRHHEHRPDYIVMDDLDDDELCLNPARVQRLTDWVREALFGALDGGRGRFIMVGNLISRTSVLSAFSQIDGVKVSRVDILDSAGNVSWAAKWSREEVAAMERFQGYRSFQREYMNNPITEGAVFRREWIRWEKRPAWREFDDIVVYIDPAWKGSARSDYKAAKMWGRKGTRLWQLRAFVRQCSVPEMVRWCYDLSGRATAEGAALRFYMEAGFMQDELLKDFDAEGEARGWRLPVIPDRRKKPDKFSRIEAAAAHWERGFVFYDESQRRDPDMLAGLEQTLAFQKGMRGHDDAPDADEGAITTLQIHARVSAFEPIIGRNPAPKNIW